MNLLKQYIKEAILICIFILLNWNLGDIRSVILFALAYIIYIISESKNVKMVLSNIKSIRR